VTASAKEDKRLVKKVDFTYLHRLFAAVALIGFAVVCAAGLLAEVNMITIILRATVVMVAVKLISWVVIKVLASYEEMNSGQA
jgi:hypothetical protein